jgi:hypothetical protein
MRRGLSGDAGLFTTAAGRCQVESIDSEAFLCCSGALEDLRLMPGVAGSVSSRTVSQAIDALRLNDLISISREGGVLRISRGPRAKSLREGSATERP